MEIKILIEAPELASALNHLADAVSRFGEVKIHSGIAAALATPTKPFAPVIQAPVTVAASAPNPAPAAPAAPMVQAPVAPQPVAPAPAANPIIPPPLTVAPAAVVPQSAHPTTMEAPAAEQPAPHKYTMQDIAKVGSALLDKGMMPQLSAILSEMGVQAIPQLREDQYPIVAEKLIALGGKFE